MISGFTQLRMNTLSPVNIQLRKEWHIVQNFLNMSYIVESETRMLQFWGDGYNEHKMKEIKIL